MDEKLKKYPKTDLFEVVGTLDVPHSYIINQNHLSYVMDNNFDKIDDEIIQKAELEGYACCGFTDCRIRHEFHRGVLIINCKSDDKMELYKYLLNVNKLRISDGFIGFVFKKGE